MEGAAMEMAAAPTPLPAELAALAPLVAQLARIAAALEALPGRAILTPAPPAEPPPLSPADQALLDALRRWRSDTARRDGLPAYIVAFNATLQEIAVRRPGSIEELGTVRGLGPAKLAKYGKEILEVVARQPTL
jgi:superfamily II DNA helicase RecQ